LEFQPQDIETIHSVSVAQNYLIKGLDRRLTTLETNLVASQEKANAANSQVLEIKLLLQRLTDDFEDQNKQVEEKAKEDRQLIQNIRAGVALFMATSVICLVGTTLFPFVGNPNYRAPTEAKQVKVTKSARD
jgi:hypothetical protein